MELLSLRTAQFDFNLLVGNGYDFSNKGLDGGEAGVVKLIFINKTNEACTIGDIPLNTDASTLDLAATGTGNPVQFRFKVKFAVAPTSGYITVIYLTPPQRPKNC